MKTTLASPEICHGPQEQILWLCPDGRLGELLEDLWELWWDLDGVVGVRGGVERRHTDQPGKMFQGAKVIARRGIC